MLEPCEAKVSCTVLRGEWGREAPDLPDRKTYKDFVSKGTPEEINRIFGGKNLPPALGSKDFLDWVKGSFFFGKRHKEAPDSKNLSPDAERIKGEICRRYRVAMDELHRSRRGITNEPRNVAIYLLRSLRGDNLEEIGREFNITRFSSVSSVVERMRGKISGDRQLRRRVEEIKTAIYMSQA
jgi:putative transposase